MTVGPANFIGSLFKKLLEGRLTVESCDSSIMLLLLSLTQGPAGNEHNCLLFCHAFMGTWNRNSLGANNIVLLGDAGND